MTLLNKTEGLEKFRRNLLRICFTTVLVMGVDITIVVMSWWRGRHHVNFFCAMQLIIAALALVSWCRKIRLVSKSLQWAVPPWIIGQAVFVWHSEDVSMSHAIWTVTISKYMVFALVFVTEALLIPRSEMANEKEGTYMLVNCPSVSDTNRPVGFIFAGRPFSLILCYKVNTQLRMALAISLLACTLIWCDFSNLVLFVIVDCLILRWLLPRIHRWSLKLSVEQHKALDSLNLEVEYTKRALQIPEEIGLATLLCFCMNAVFDLVVVVLTC
jgi:hypothetical protein